MHEKALFQLLAKASVLSVASWRPTDIVWLENGLAIRILFVDLFRGILKQHGYKEVLMPAFIPEGLMNRQQAHFRDVERISFFLGNETECYLRATSESQFAAFVSSDGLRSLPTRMFQVCSVYRREQNSKLLPLLRAIEIDPFIEAMTFTNDSSKEMAREACLYETLFHRLCLPTHEIVRPSWDTFPEATRTIAFDTVLPRKGAIQVASVHNLSTSFARVFDLRNAKSKYVQQTSSGISGRALLAVMMMHLRAGKLFLPSSLCPKLLLVPKKLHAIVMSIVDDDIRHRIEVEENIDLHSTIIPFPIRIVSIAGKQIRVLSAVGGQSSIESSLFANGIREMLKDHDRKLLGSAKTKIKRDAHSDGVVRELPSCGEIACLLDRMNKSLTSRQFMGFVRAEKVSRRCPACHRTQDYTARFALPL